MRFVDTNVFIRTLTGDDPGKAEACFRLFRRLEGGLEEATTNACTLAEVVFVLESRRNYGLPRSEVRRLLQPMLEVPALHLDGRRELIRALDLYADYHIDFEDALAVVDMEQRGIREIYSYDRGFDRLPSISRMEPA